MPARYNFSKKTILLIIIFLLITVSLFGTLCVTSVKSIEADAQEILNDASNNNTTLTTSAFDYFFKELEDTVIEISDNSNITPTDKQRITEVLDKKDTFITLGVTYPDHDGFASDGQLFTAGNCEIINIALNGQRKISFVDNDITYKHEYFLFALPIMSGQKVTSVVYAKLEKSEFLKSYATGVLSSGIAESYLVNNRMTSLIDKTETTPVDEFTKLSRKQQEQIQELLSQEDFEPTVIKNQDVYLHYQPLNINGFHMLTIMRLDSVMGNSKAAISWTLCGLTVFVIMFFVTIIMISNSYDRNRRRIRETSVELETVMNNISGGVVRFNCDRNYTIRFLNEGLLSLTGYTYKDLQSVIRNSFINFIHKDDRLKFVKMFENQLATGIPIEMDCRLMKKDGSYTWFLIKGNAINRDETNPSCLCVLTDISTMKLAEHELNLTMQRYSVIIEQSDSVVFEYSFVDKSMYLSSKWSDKFDFPPNTPNFFESAIHKEFIHPDDVKRATDVFTSVLAGAIYRKSDVRLRSVSGDYIWCTIRASAIFDEDGNTYKTVGKVIDVDKQYHETEILKKKAELDSLTGIYNKGTTQMLIDNFLQNEGKEGAHALLIMDIDNFKRINDTLGHLVGDTVIADITARARSLLRSGDIFGRIGGDEFVVLLKGVGDLNNVKKKADELRYAFCHTICGEGPSLDISGSIGIAFSNKNTATYKLLVDKADTALYEAKKNGKNQYCIYGA